MRCALALVAVALALTGSAAAGVPPPPGSDSQCGPRCLAICADLLGVEAELAHVAELPGHDRLGGTSLAGLAEGAEALGLEAHAYRLALSDLQHLNPSCPAIAHIDGNHFVVVWADGPEQVALVDPSQGLTTASLRSLGRRWGGAALVVSRPGEQPSWADPWFSGGLVGAGAALAALGLLRLVVSRGSQRAA